MADEIKTSLEEIKEMLRKLIDQAEINASLIEAILDEIIPATITKE